MSIPESALPLAGDPLAEGAASPAPSAAPNTGPQRLVDLVDVRKHFGSVQAVDGVSLHIYQGEFFSLLGPSGSGKTTLLNLIGGFEHVSSGQVLIEGKVINDLPPFRRPVNTVFQSYALFPHMSVEKNVGYPLKMADVPRPERKTLVREALEMVGLVGFERRRPNELSGGQRQRVALARALVGRPRVLLLDEPLGALDLQLRQQMQTMLKRLQRTVGITFVYVTHDQGEALSMSDRVAVISDGKIEQIGTPREIYAKPTTRFVASFIGRTNFLPLTSEGERWLVAGKPVLENESAHGKSATTLAVRPEGIGLNSEADTRDNVFAAHVVETVYLGDTVRVVAEIAEGVTVEITVPAASGELAAPGAIRIGWNDADSVLLVD